MHRDQLSLYLDRLLEPSRFRDYCPNGLQVEGRQEIASVVTGVTANLALIERAVAIGADAILVHHGYFWRGEDPRVIGSRRARLALLLAHGLNLYAYHLPLDAHPEIGNNAQLAAALGFCESGRAGEQDLLSHGALPAQTTVSALAAAIESRLERAPLVIGEPGQTLRRVAWCTGAAQGMFEDAIALGVDAFITGEISEHQVHLARESGIAFFAAGHHATERFGVRALGERLARDLGVAHRFFEIGSPV
ncbi:MAG: Nif3-like dinuclear metal center hexameric protein [Betaproteobacteria bacterium]|nr:Nif3-like dinuclear metal center hexameric protein [Betaproteobacteria bacterium]